MPRAEVPEGRRERPAEKAKRAGVKLFTPVYIKDKGVGMKEDDDRGSYLDVAELHRLYQHWLDQFKEELLADEAIDVLARRIARRSSGRKDWDHADVRHACRQKARRDIEALLASIPIEGEGRS